MLLESTALWTSPKTVPAKDGANVVLCTDPAEYPDNMHYHKEFQAKDICILLHFHVIFVLQSLISL